MIRPTHSVRPTMPLTIIATCIALSACGGGQEPVDASETAQGLVARELRDAAPNVMVASQSTASTMGAGNSTGAVAGSPAGAGASRFTAIAGSGTTTAQATNVAQQTTTGIIGVPVESRPAPLPAQLPPASNTQLDGSGVTKVEPTILIPQTGAGKVGKPVTLPPQPLPVEPSPPSGTRLDSSGVLGSFASGCTPALGSDFIDTASWSNRRLEPRDCALVYLSTPVFSWTQPADRDTSVPWTLEVRQASGAVVATRTSSVPRVLLSDLVLPSASYTWTVSYTTKKGAAVTSQARRFVVAPASTLTQLPSGAAFAAAVVAKPRPRALPAGASLAGIAAAAAAGEYKAPYAAFLAQAATLAAQAPGAVPKNLARSDFASDTSYVNWKQDLARTAKTERVAIETLGYAALLTGNTAYASAGAARVLSLAAWPTDGATSQAVQDQANREIYFGLGLGLDLYKEQLNATQRTAVVNSLRARLSQVLVEFPGLDTSPYDSHGITATQFVMEALTYAAGTPEFPEAQSLLAAAWERWITTLGTWGGSDGAFGNSTAYGWYALSYMAPTVAMVRTVVGLDLSKWPVVGGFGNNMIEFTAPVASSGGQFGDQVEFTPIYKNYSYDEFRLYASAMRKPEYEWYWRAYPANLNTKAPLPPLHYMLLGVPGTAATPAAPTANSIVFEDAGLVAMHSNVADPARTSVFFRSSRLGSYNHSHADNNAFTFVSKGQPLLISGGYYPYYRSPHHATVGRATRFKNALTFDGGIGQAEPSANPAAPGNPVFSMDARGTLLHFADDGRWAVTTGDAALAYRGQDPKTLAWTPLLNSAVRSVAFQRAQGVVVIYDWATSNTPRRWELNFQAPTPPALAGHTVRIDNGGSSACIDVYGSGGSFKLSSGFPIAPETSLPDEYQARYFADAASTELVAVTVIREACRNVAIDVRIAGTSASVSIDGGAPIVADRQSVTVPSK